MPKLLPSMRRNRRQDARRYSVESLFEDVPERPRRGPRNRWTPEKELALLEAVDAVRIDPAAPPSRRSDKGALEYLIRNGLCERLDVGEIKLPALRNRLSAIRQAPDKPEPEAPEFY